MLTCLFSRLPAVFARAVVLLVLLPWLAWTPSPSKAQAQPLSRPRPQTFSQSLLPAQASGWTAGDLSYVYDTIHADLAAQASRPASSWSQLNKVIADDADHMVSFGWAVDVDGNQMIVGATNGAVYDATDNEDYYSGLAYIFEKSSTFGWSTVHLVSKIYPADYKSAHSFGFSVAIQGNRAVIGAPDSHVPWECTPGGAYFFEHTSEGWVQLYKLLHADYCGGTSTPRFGYDVDIDGDVIIVGAPMEDVLVTPDRIKTAGSAYIFQIPTGGWGTSLVHESGFFRPVDWQQGEAFGAAVAVSGNIVMAGRYAYTPPSAPAGEIAYGKVNVFELPSGMVWGNVQSDDSFMASDAADHEYFGWAIALEGNTAVIGAEGEYASDDNGEESVYVFERPAGGWHGQYTETARLTASDGHIYDDFGRSIGLSGDTIVVGAPEAGDSIITKEGAVYIFEKPAGGWVDMMTESHKLLPEDVAAGEEFGYDVAIDGTTVVAGVPLSTGRFGSAYVYSSTADPVTLKIFLPAIVKR